MRLKKIFITFVVTAPIVAAIPSVSNCSKTNNSAFEYIYNRTFALWGYNKISGEGSAGTCWILSDATPNDTTDYKYYIATNWHVKRGIDDCGSEQQMRIVYGSSTSNISQSSYLDFKSFSWKDQKQFQYDETDTKKSIDLFIAEADFANDNMTDEIKNKFAVLNEQQNKKGYINKFAQSTDSMTYVNKDFYLAGYPVKDDSQQWNKETIKANNSNYYKYSVAAHGIDNNYLPFATIIDISPQYAHTNGFECDEFGKTVTGWSLTSGASGSMIICDINGEWNVIGIFWGGYISNFSGFRFHPSISVFKSDAKNFVSQYE